MMVSVLHCLKGEYEKSKHSILRSIHWIIPFLCAVIFAGYYHVSVWEKSVKISTYLETLAVAFPFELTVTTALLEEVHFTAFVAFAGFMVVTFKVMLCPTYKVFFVAFNLRDVAFTAASTSRDCTARLLTATVSASMTAVIFF